jgi:hypothetical protein
MIEHATSASAGHADGEDGELRSTAEGLSVASAFESP